MLLRFDPFRDIDRLANEILGAPRAPQPMPMDCYRHGDTFFLHFDLPGIDTDTLDVTEENNILTVRAQRSATAPEDAAIPVAEQAKPRRIDVGRSQDSGTALTGGGHKTISGQAAEGDQPVGATAT
jgi:HSP20 family protein